MHCCSCIAEGAPLRCAVCHTFSSSFLRSGSSCGLCLTSFIASSFRSIPLHSQPGICLRSPVPHPMHKAKAAAAHRLLHQAQCSFHYISASLRYSFTSVRRSPPAAFCCCARLAATACVTGQRWHRSTLIRLTPYATRCPFTVCPSPPAKAVGFTGHPSRWHSQAIPSYLLHCL